MQSNAGEAEGGLKGRDLSGLDCVLIEVTCIKWNLIGTDTGSLTDRHDADGLRRGGERGSEGGREWRQRGSAIEERENSSKLTSFCNSTWSKEKSFMTAKVKIKTSGKRGLISRLCRDWQLMRHVTQRRTHTGEIVSDRAQRKSLPSPSSCHKHSFLLYWK